MYETAPSLEIYASGGVFNNTYYISPNGNDTSGDGSLGNPWASINGARTGGAGNPAVAGDLVYFRGGVYNATQSNTGWKSGYYYYDTNGTATDYIVFTAYPSEAPVFTTTADSHISIDIRGDYVVVDSLSFTTGSLTVHSAAHVVVQNCSFAGDPYDPMGDQLNDGHFYVGDGAHYLTIRNNYFASVGAHAVKTYSSSDMPKNLMIEFNVFKGGSVSYGLVAFKSAITDFEVRYNRFESVSADTISIGSSYSGSHNGLNIHHNAFDNCTGSILTKLGTSTTGEVVNLQFHDNIVLNATSGDRDMLELDCNDGCLVGAMDRLGEFYNNAFYDLVDVIDPETTTDFTNYPSYFNYNAYPSTSLENSAENANNESSLNWQENAVVQPSHGITRIGTSGNYFYTIEDNNAFVGKGRNGDNIGGFQWTGKTALLPPSHLRIVL